MPDVDPVTRPERRRLYPNEERLLQSFGTPDKDDIKILVTARDHTGKIDAAMNEGIYHFIPEYWGERRKSAAVLDSLLQSADPKIRGQLASYGIPFLAREENRETKIHSSPGDRLGIPPLPFHSRRERPFNTMWTDATDKLSILGQHGADLNQAVLAADNINLVMRNANILKRSGQTLNRGAAEHIANHVSDFVTKSPAYSDILLNEQKIVRDMVAVGVSPKAPMVFKSQLYTGIYNVQDQLSVALLVDPTHKLFEKELAKGTKPDVSALFYNIGQLQVTKDDGRAKENSTQTSDTFDYLKKKGFDINAQDANGRTALTRLMQDFKNSKLVELSGWRQGHIFAADFTQADHVIALFKDAGANGKIKDHSGKSAEDYYMDIRSGFNAKQEAIVRSYEKTMVSPSF